MTDKLKKMMPPGQAAQLLGHVFVQRVLAEQTFLVGTYEQVRAALNPLRAALGYDEVATPGGVRGAGFDLAKERYGAYVFADRSPVLIPSSPLLLEALIRHNYGLEVLNLWRTILNEHGFPIAPADELLDFFGPSDPGPDRQP